MAALQYRSKQENTYKQALFSDSECSSKFIRHQKIINLSLMSILCFLAFMAYSCNID